jgi:PAS domain S-box-containing protein
MSDGSPSPEVMQSLHVGLWMIDHAGVSTYVNDRLAELLGLPAAEILGRPLLDHFHPADHEVLVAHIRSRRHGTRDHYDVRLQRSDGTTLPVRISGSPVIVDGAFAGSVAAITDLSDLAEASLAKTRLLSWVSHELRTPLNTISGFAQLLESSVPDPAQRDMATSILSACAHINGVVQDLLDYAKADADMLDPELTSEPMKAVLEDALALVAGAAREHAVTIDLHVADECVLAERRHLVQSVLNLLSNAVKYGGSGTTVTVRVERDGDVVRCSITDQGPGIPAADRLRAFRAFERLDTDVPVEGVGLGLAIADSFVRAMHGSLSVSGEPGQGATFTITLPSAPPTTSSGLVLYVEDEPLNASLVESIIGLLPGRRLHLEPTVAGGIAALHRLRPALVLLDLNLPDGSGFEVLAAVRADPSMAGVPVFILSADATEQATTRALELGADRFITKPFNLKEFVALVEAAT